MPETRARRSTLARPTMSRTREAAALSERRIIGPSRARSPRESGRPLRSRSRATRSITLKTLAAGAVLSMR
jgi:hypothetical protein